MVNLDSGCLLLLGVSGSQKTKKPFSGTVKVLKLMKTLCRERGTAVLIITHDMGVVADMCHRVAIMYAGRVVEYTDVFTLFSEPAHPYTEALLRSLPRLGAKRNRLDSIEGLPPQLNRLPSGCAFESRCEYSTDRCIEKPPELTRLSEGHDVRCYYPINGGKR